MDVVFYAKKKYAHILNHVPFHVILDHMYNAKKKLRFFAIVKKRQKLCLALLKVKKNFAAMKYVESN